MSHAEICPVCNGSGEVWKELNPGTSGSHGQKQTCNGCGGLGWITVGTEYPPMRYDIWANNKPEPKTQL